MSGRRLQVLFGSETGTAEDVAWRVHRQAKCRHFNTKTHVLDDYPVGNLLCAPLVVFIVATTGQGDPPENMKKFWKFLFRRNLPSNSLVNVKFAVLALGDSTYQKYNFIGKKLHKRLLQLGGTSVQPIGLANDQHQYGPDAVIDPWLKSFWTHALRLHPLPPGQQVITTDRPTPKYKLNLCTTATIPGLEPSLPQPDSDTMPSQNCPYLAKVTGNARVTATDHWQDTRHIRLNISSSAIRYNPGDVLMVQPKNMSDTVDDLLRLLNVDGGQQFILQQNDPDIPLPLGLPIPCTFRYLAEVYLDINAIPRRYFWELLAYFTDNELEREKLIEFTSPEGQDELFTYCNRPRRKIVEILADFPHATANIQLDYLFDLIPRLQPRAFSIASSQNVQPDEVELLVAVVKYMTNLVSERRGVCSTYLSSLNPSKGDEHVAVWMKKGTLTFQQTADVPLIMVGPGTGCAPFKSVCEDRSFNNLASNVLFFGCRNQMKDFYFECSWHRLAEKHRLQLYTAFSRDQDQKVYVQHKMAEQHELIWKLLDEQNAYFYLSGNSKEMPDDVRNTLLKIVQKDGKRSANDAEAYVRSLETSRRYQTETWS